jgi:uncharacterized protein (TIGR02757 family)
MDRTTSVNPKTVFLLDKLFEKYHTTDFISDDPVCIPHDYTQKQDIEITALFAALLAWGQRKTIIQKCKDLFTRMDNAPYEFILNHTEKDYEALSGFKHRTFNEVDVVHFVTQLQKAYQQYNSLEPLFEVQNSEENIYAGLVRFHSFMLENAPVRTRKHISTPVKNSACKRINMFLRWMVRTNSPVDFGIWTNIQPSQLVCPLDVHVHRAAIQLQLIGENEKPSWKTAVKLTELLKILSSDDPVKYDFALFGWSKYHLTDI